MSQISLEKGERCNLTLDYLWPAIRENARSYLLYLLVMVKLTQIRKVLCKAIEHEAQGHARSIINAMVMVSIPTRGNESTDLLGNGVS